MNQNVEKCVLHVPAIREEHFHDKGEECTNECYTEARCQTCGEKVTA